MVVVEEKKKKKEKLPLSSLSFGTQACSKVVKILWRVGLTKSFIIPASAMAISSFTEEPKLHTTKRKKKE